MSLLGELVAVSMPNKTFQINSDEGETIEGSFEDAITAEHAASVPARYRTTITKTTRIIQKPKKEKKDKEKPITYFLTSLEPLSPVKEKKPKI